HGTLQLLIQFFQGLLAFAPSLRTARRHRRPRFFRRELRRLATKPPKDQIVSTDQMKDDLPNAVRSGYWASCGIFRRDTRQHLEYRGPMPGLAPEGPADLIRQELQIQGHRLSHSSGSAERHGSVAGPAVLKLSFENLSAGPVNCIQSFGTDSLRCPLFDLTPLTCLATL